VEISHQRLATGILAGTGTPALGAAFPITRNKQDDPRKGLFIPHYVLHFPGERPCRAGTQTWQIGLSPAHLGFERPWKMWIVQEGLKKEHLLGRDLIVAWIA
jgi:hypothetical protein